MRRFAGTAVLLAALIPLDAGALVAPRQARGIGDLVRELKAQDPATRGRAACALREAGDRAAEAVPALAALLPDGAPLEPDVCPARWTRGGEHDLTSPGELAATALASIGSRAYDTVRGALTHDVWIARRNAAWTLGALEDRRAVSALIEALTDREAGVREQAAWALGALDDSAAVDALVRALQDADARVRHQAAWALGAIDDATAVDALVGALTDAAANVRSQAAWALGAISR
jgi:HEAT repeat protein